MLHDCKQLKLCCSHKNIYHNIAVPSVREKQMVAWKMAIVANYWSDHKFLPALELSLKVSFIDHLNLFSESHISFKALNVEFVPTAERKQTTSSVPNL